MRIPGVDEEVEPVTSFEELRVGLIVWVFPCTCQGKHRIFLMRREMGTVRYRNGFADCVPHFYCEPKHPSCSESDPISAGSVIIPQHVAMGLVYRVVDPLMERGDLRDMQRRHDEFEAALVRVGGKLHVM